MNNHKSFYKNNDTYSTIVENQPIKQFHKYVDYITQYTPSEGRFLEVGCGTGLAMGLLKDRKLICTGVDVSITSLRMCKLKGLNCLPYDGDELPFASGSFDSVGSYNVLEHTDDPISFLDEQVRVLVKGGHLIIACPNFLSITNNYHDHTRGILNKSQNLVRLVYKSISSHLSFDKMETIHREEFQPDDDACNVTNPVDLRKWAKRNNLKLLYWSSQSIYREGLINYLDVSFLRNLFGSSFFVFLKNE